jgi:hypothetical protein
MPESAILFRAYHLFSRSFVAARVNAYGDESRSRTAEEPALLEDIKIDCTNLARWLSISR